LDSVKGSRDKPITRPLPTWGGEGRKKQIYFHAAKVQLLIKFQIKDLFDILCRANALKKVNNYRRLIKKR
jgi:hypothetical protein